MSDKTKNVPLYRVENPRIAAHPDGITSHPDLVGQWFTPNIAKTVHYLRKSTRTFGPSAADVSGVQLVIVQVPIDKLDALHVTRNSAATGMDVESDNYLIPRDGSIETTVIALDDTLADLKGKLARPDALLEASRRLSMITENLGTTALKKG